MFCKYITTATPNQAQVLSDIVALYTGSITDKNNLSASCDKTLTDLTTTVAGGWILHDDNAGTNIKVLKAPCADNINQFKYLYLNCSATTTIEMRVYETWNATAHTGTNVINTTLTNTGQRVVYTQSFMLLLGSSVRFAWMTSKYGSTTGSFQATSAYCIEYTRWSPWDTTAAGYPPFVGTSSGSPGFARMRGPVADQTATVGQITTPIGVSLSKVSNTSGQLVIPLVSIFAHASNSGHFGGNISEQCGIYGTCGQLGAEGDELTINGTTYVLINGNALATGNVPVLIPKV